MPMNQYANENPAGCSSSDCSTFHTSARLERQVQDRDKSRCQLLGPAPCFGRWFLSALRDEPTLAMTKHAQPQI